MRTIMTEFTRSRFKINFIKLQVMNQQMRDLLCREILDQTVEQFEDSKGRLEDDTALHKNAHQWVTKDQRSITIRSFCSIFCKTVSKIKDRDSGIEIRSFQRFIIYSVREITVWMEQRSKINLFRDPFVRSMAYWVLKDYSRAAHTLVVEVNQSN